MRIPLPGGRRAQALLATAALTVAGQAIDVRTEATFQSVDRRLGEIRRPARVTPAVSVLTSPAIAVVPLNGPRSAASPLHVTVRARSEAPGGLAGTLSLDTPAGWKVEPASVPVRFAAEGEEHSPLMPIWVEVILSLVVFGLLVLAFKKFVVPNFESTFAERTEAIEGGLSAAADKQAEADAKLAELEKQLADARHEAARIREEAREQGAQIIAQHREQAQAEAERITTNAQAQLEVERAQALSQLKNEVGTIATTLAGRIVGESLDDDDRQKRSVERFIAELEEWREEELIEQGAVYAARQHPVDLRLTGAGASFRSSPIVSSSASSAVEAKATRACRPSPVPLTAACSPAKGTWPPPSSRSRWRTSTPRWQLWSRSAAAPCKPSCPWARSSRSHPGCHATPARRFIKALGASAGLRR